MLEGQGEIDRLPGAGDVEGTRAWGYELLQRDALIARCALILAHRLLMSPLAKPLRDDMSYPQIEAALEWLYRG